MNKKLHILFLCGWYPSKILPNNGNFIKRHAEAVSLKHNVSVLHIISDKNCSKSINIETKEINGVKTHIGYVKETKNLILKLFRFWKVYFILLKKIKPFNIVHLNEIFPFGLFALHLKFFKKKSYIISEHWTDYKYPLSNKISFLEKILSKLIVKKASFVCPVSKSLQKDMETFGLKGNYKIVPNIIDVSVFVTSKKKEKNYTIIHVSNLYNNQKNIVGMLNVAKKLESKIKNFTWKFIGGNKEEYATLIKKLNFTSAKIEFINYVAHKNLVAHLQNSNLCVSFSNYETFGIVMVEALSCGIPVISTNTGILNELKPTDFFRIIPVKDEEKLQDEIIYFYDNKTALTSKEKMRDYINTRFSNRSVCEEFTTLYKKTLNL